MKENKKIKKFTRNGVTYNMILDFDEMKIKLEKDGKILISSDRFVDKSSKKKAHNKLKRYILKNL